MKLPHSLAKYHSITLAILASVSTLALTSTTQAQPLESMLNGLVEQHPQVRAQQESLESAKAGKEEAFAGYLPTVDLSGSSGPEGTDRTETDPAGSYEDFWTDSYGLTVTQNLFSGKRTTATNRTADTTVDIAETSLNLTTQQILFEGITAYLEVLRQIELSNLALENENTLKEQLHLEDERVQRGSGIAVDVLQAKSRLQISRERYTAFMGALKDAISRYTQVYNQVPELDHMQTPAIPLHLVPETLDTAIDIALKENPTLHISNYSLDVADAAKTTAKAGYFPTFDLVGSANYDDDISGTAGQETKYAVQLKTTWQLYSGFADRARIRKASHDYLAATESDVYTRRKAIEEVKLAWSSLNTSRDRLALLQNAVNIAGEVYDARTRLRDAGSETAINVLDAENELFRAKIDAASAKFDYYNAVYRLVLAMGRLTLNNAVSIGSHKPTPITPRQEPEAMPTPWQKKAKYSLYLKDFLLRHLEHCRAMERSPGIDGDFSVGSCLHRNDS